MISFGTIFFVGYVLFAVAIIYTLLFGESDFHRRGFVGTNLSNATFPSISTPSSRFLTLSPYSHSRRLPPLHYARFVGSSQVRSPILGVTASRNLLMPISLTLCVLCLCTQQKCWSQDLRKVDFWKVCLVQRLDLEQTESFDASPYYPFPLLLPLSFGSLQPHSNTSLCIDLLSVLGCWRLELDDVERIRICSWPSPLLNPPGDLPRVPDIRSKLLPLHQQKRSWPDHEGELGFLQRHLPKRSRHLRTRNMQDMQT